MISRIVRTLAILGAVTLIGWGLFASDRTSDAHWLAILGIAWVLLLIGTYVPLPDTLPTFNRTTIRTAFAFSTVFAVIAAQLVRVQAVQREAIYTKTGIAPDGEPYANPRTVNTGLDTRRGRIFDRSGEVIADTTERDGIFFRSWPNPVTAYVAGFYSPLMYGASGLEATWNDDLSGSAGRNAVDRAVNELLDRSEDGFDLYLTLDTALQQQATDLLSGRKGAVVLLDPHTGETLAFASVPNYDPNRLFSTTTAENDGVRSYWDELSKDPAAPFVLRANLGLYTPGSTFKTITSAAAIETGTATPDTVYQDNGELVIDGRTLVENNRPDPSRTEWTLEEGVAWSLNVVFAQVGLQLGANRLWDYGTRFGFETSPPFDLPVAQSQIASSRSFLDSQNALADTAFGQGQILTTPLQMALVAATFAAGGTAPTPYLVSRVADSTNKTIRTNAPGAWQKPVSASTANQVAGMMVNAVQNGSVQAAITAGYTVGGKTGTAETGDGSIHSWFIGFIGQQDSRYAIAVVLEEGSDSLGTSVNIGQALLQGAMERT
ncbi:MAG: penicillin-binding protein 2 [Thermomicrobiales bacterium]